MLPQIFATLSQSWPIIFDSMKTLFRFVLLGLVLLVVALVSALTAMRFAIHGQETKVPDLVGKTPAEARRIAEASGLEIQVEQQFFSPSVPEGRILSQLPAAGERVRRGWQLRVAESLGPQRAEIPNLIGTSERAAEINIRRRSLDASTVSQVPMADVPIDQVVAQSPAPNASGVSTPKIDLLTAENAAPQAFIMPSFVGQTLVDATTELKTAGFQLTSVTAEGPSDVPGPEMTSPASTTGLNPLPASVIISQSPVAGVKVVAGAGISFRVR
jgi:eukaryotic-like serine/threonine-protein kinase